MSRDTDVPGSIAGYYYQILLATRELVQLFANDSKIAVGIEKGSDIKVLSNQANNYCIEVKFYKNDSFTKEHQTIRHTLFNFYDNYLTGNPNEYLYKTNVKVNDRDKTFFDNWPQETNEYILFVKDCLVHEAIVLASPYKENFAEFCNGLKQRADYVDKFSYKYTALVAYLHQNPTEYNRYFNFRSDEDLLTFINKVKFEFSPETQSKLDAIMTVITEINTALSNYDNNLTQADCDKIRNLIIEAFFETCFNHNRQYVKREDLINIVSNYNDALLKYLEDELLKLTIQSMEDELIKFDQFLEQHYNGQKRDELRNSYVTLTEKVYETLTQTGIRPLIDRFSLEDNGTIRVIMNLILKLSIYTVFTEQDLSGSKFVTSGINNFSLKNDDHLCLKGTESCIWNQTEILLTAFIRKSMRYIQHIHGGETIIFQAPDWISGGEPCNFDLGVIDKLIPDTGQVEETLKYQTLFKSLHYRCTNCMKLFINDEQCIDLLKRFYQEACSGSHC